jgi:hypothetical protein
MHENNFPPKTLKTRIELLLHFAIDIKDFQEPIFARKAAYPWMRPFCQQLSQYLSCTCTKVEVIATSDHNKQK